MRAAAQLSPHDALYHHNLSWLLYFRDGVTKACLRSMQRARKLDPSNGWYLVSLGRMQREIGWPAEAEQCLREAMALGFPLAEARWELGRLLSEASRPAEATAELEKCLALVTSRIDATDLLLPGYHIGPRYRRWPIPDEPLTGIELLRDPKPVADLLTKCRGEAGADPPASGQEEQGDGSSPD